MIDRAYYFARDRHKGQKDDSGKDFFTAHIRQVGRLVAMVTDDPEIIAAAYLHDTIEDTKTEYIELSMLFTPRIAGLVYEVTKENGIFPHLKTKDAALIKFADRLSNLSRMEPWDQKRQDRYLEKSAFWKLPLYE